MTTYGASFICLSSYAVLYLGRELGRPHFSFARPVAHIPENIDFGICDIDKYLKVFKKLRNSVMIFAHFFSINAMSKL